MPTLGEDMAAKPKKDPLAALMALPGVGKATAQNELNELNVEYNGDIPTGILQRKYKELEKRYPHLDVRSLQVGSQGITNGGDYPNAGQGDLNINYYKEFETELKGPSKLALTRKQKLELNKAYGEFTRLVKIQTRNGI